MANFYLPERKETEVRYDNNGYVNMLISAMFKKSIADFDEKDYREVVPQLTNGCMYAAWDERFKDIPYGAKTLGEAGCAVFCFCQGLHTRSIYTGMDMEAFAKYIADKGYYEFGRGTYHNLFDHYGLRRATHFREIFDALRMGKIVTLLVENKDYLLSNSEGGSHYVNIIGNSGVGFIIYDSKTQEIINCSVPMRKVFDATRVAWLW